MKQRYEQAFLSLVEDHKGIIYKVALYTAITNYRNEKNQKEKSKNVLKNIERRLMRELLIIILALVCFDVLFFIVKIPLTPLRWICFTILNLTTFLHAFFYLRGISKSKLNYGDDLESNLQRIIQGLTQFRNQHKLVNIPIGFVCILMFAGAQDLFVLMTWMIVEFLFWRWLLLPKMKSRFLDYLSDLEYTFKQIQERNE